jgi:hypothetical protein
MAKWEWKAHALTYNGRETGVTATVAHRHTKERIVALLNAAEPGGAIDKANKDEWGCEGTRNALLPLLTEGDSNARQA